MKKRLTTITMIITMVLGIFLGATALQTPANVQAAQGSYYTVYGTTNYLALRTSACYDDRNEIGRIYNGDSVMVCDTNTGNVGYWYVYSPTLGKYGYVNKGYLSNGSGLCVSNNGYYVVRGVKNYLAIRTDTCYNDSNEIGRIYNGDTVQLINANTGNAGYWEIYSPSTGLTGYVNRSYLS